MNYDIVHASVDGHEVNSPVHVILINLCTVVMLDTPYRLAAVHEIDRMNAKLAQGMYIALFIAIQALTRENQVPLINTHREGVIAMLDVLQHDGPEKILARFILFRAARKRLG